MRECTKCNTQKPISEFYKHTCGYRHNCKTCHAEKAKEWATKNKDRRLEIVKASRAKTDTWKNYRNKWKSLNGQSAERRAKQTERTPHWVDKDELFLIREAYSLCRLREMQTGIKWHVDHIVPLRGKHVSGLHTIMNLQVIPAVINLHKSNKMHFQLKDMPK